MNSTKKQQQKCLPSAQSCFVTCHGVATAQLTDVQQKPYTFHASFSNLPGRQITFETILRRTDRVLVMKFLEVLSNFPSLLRTPFSGRKRKREQTESEDADGSRPPAADPVPLFVQATLNPTETHQANTIPSFLPQVYSIAGKQVCKFSKPSS